MDTINLALKYFKEKQYEKSLEKFLEALKSDPNNVNILNNIGLVYSNLSDDNKAIEYYKKALKINPNLDQTIINLSDSYIKTNEIMLCLVLLQDYINKNPKNHTIKHYFARVLILDKRYDEAIHILNEILDDDPKNYEANWDLAQIYFDLGNYELAISEFENTIKNSNTQSPIIYYQTALAYEANSEIPKAISKHISAIVANEKFQPSYKRLAMLFMAQGDFRSAIDYFEEYLKFDLPEDENNEIMNLIKRLKMNNL